MSITQNEIKNVKSLLSKKGRRTHNKFSAEGVRLLEEAFQSKFFPDIIYYTPHSLSVRGQGLIDNFEKKGIEIVEVKSLAMEKMCDTKNNQGILGVFALPDIESGELFEDNYRKILWCDNIADPGNIGTLFRTALAFGFNKVILSGNNADPFSPKVTRSSAGAVFKVQFWKSSCEEILKSLHLNDVNIIAADIRGESWEKNLKLLKKDMNLVLAVGSEADGLTDMILQQAEFVSRIEHFKSTESLNAAVAGSIMMNDIFREIRD